MKLRIEKNSLKIVESMKEDETLTGYIVMPPNPMNKKSYEVEWLPEIFKDFGTERIDPQGMSASTLQGSRAWGVRTPMNESIPLTAIGALVVGVGNLKTMLIMWPMSATIEQGSSVPEVFNMLSGWPNAKVRAFMVQHASAIVLEV